MEAAYKDSKVRKFLRLQLTDMFQLQILDMGIPVICSNSYNLAKF